MDKEFRDQSKVFLCTESSKEEIIMAGKRLLLIILGEQDAGNLNECRFRKFSKKCGSQVNMSFNNRCWNGPVKTTDL